MPPARHAPLATAAADAFTLKPPRPVPKVTVATCRTPSAAARTFTSQPHRLSCNLIIERFGSAQPNDDYQRAPALRCPHLATPPRQRLGSDGSSQRATEKGIDRVRGICRMIAGATLHEVDDESGGLGMRNPS